MAGPAVIRACQRAQVDPNELDSSALRQVLPYLEMTLQLYLPEEAGLRLRALDALADEARGSRPR
jgi:hypothetical protein